MNLHLELVLPLKFPPFTVQFTFAGDADSDGDGVKDSADGDDDNDGILDVNDADDDGDGIEDEDEDHDGDGISNEVNVVTNVVYVDPPPPSMTLTTMVTASRTVTRMMTATVSRTTRMLMTMATVLPMSTTNFKFVLKQYHSFYLCLSERIPPIFKIILSIEIYIIFNLFSSPL